MVVWFGEQPTVKLVLLIGVNEGKYALLVTVIVLDCTQPFTVLEKVTTCVPIGNAWIEMVLMLTPLGIKPTVVAVYQFICMLVVGVIAVAVKIGALDEQFIVAVLGLTVPVGAIVLIPTVNTCVAVQVLDGCVTITV